MPLSTRRVLAETPPIALVLLAWAVLSVLAVTGPSVRFAVQLGGFTMAVLYAVVRGVALATEATPAYENRDAEGVLVENGRAMLAGGPWFALAILAAVLERDVFGLGLPAPGPGDLVPTVMDTLAQVFAITGTLTVLLVAVATGVSAVRSVHTF